MIVTLKSLSASSWAAGEIYLSKQANCSLKFGPDLDTSNFSQTSFPDDYLFFSDILADRNDSLRKAVFCKMNHFYLTATLPLRGN